MIAAVPHPRFELVAAERDGEPALDCVVRCSCGCELRRRRLAVEHADALTPTELWNLTERAIATLPTILGALECVQCGARWTPAVTRVV